ncbi:MAG: DamX protein [Alteromonadaceae bacterium]|jgi:DamX protein
MSALAYTANKSENLPSVTTITASARIDYIFRFSKQAILIVNDQAETFAQIGGQYIAGLPNEQNTALVSISPKLNNIQVRCRIVEQLFGNSLFDPEQSLAVSIINFAKINTNAISIVVENAELLSLQLLHELCQLSEIAKKTKKDINVLLLGAIETGYEVAKNRSLFDNKISILSADSGQLISLGSKKLKKDVSFFSFTKGKKIWLASLLTLTFVILSLIALQQRELIDFSGLIQQNFDENNKIISTFVLAKKAQLNKSTSENKTINNDPQVATREDILKAIFTMEVKEENIRDKFLARASTVEYRIEKRALATNKNEIAAQEEPVLKIKPQEMINTISPVTTTKVLVSPVTKAVTFSNLESQSTIPIIERQTRPINKAYRKIDSSHYLSEKSGFVVQIAGFSQNYVFEEFIAEYSNLDYIGYYRNLNQQKFLVITSAIYPTKIAADQALLSLPKQLQERGAWIKSIEAVNNEIKQYQQSN